MGWVFQLWSQFAQGHLQPSQPLTLLTAGWWRAPWTVLVSELQPHVHLLTMVVGGGTRSISVPCHTQLCESEHMTSPHSIYSSVLSQEWCAKHPSHGLQPTALRAPQDVRNGVTENPTGVGPPPASVHTWLHPSSSPPTQLQSLL